MELNNNQDEISLKELILKIKYWYFFLVSKWMVILVAIIIGGAIGFGYAFSQKVSYTASLSFTLEDENARAGGLSITLG
jgi:uncharacterized protein involved in exopolysaccharide biosynthesis